jgi:ATP-dependent helicase/nuclease subunit A
MRHIVQPLLLDLPPRWAADQIARVIDPVLPPPTLPDASARRRIAEDLDANLLVEAGAGSGKTTELVRRMVALLASGEATVGEIAAVTFTRKAAAELRERFQAEIERRVRAGSGRAQEPAEVTERLGAALHDLDQAFVGTIHSFCARLLRERPIDVGLDPAFEELAADERMTLRVQFWESYLERMVLEEDPALEELAASGLRATALFELFGTLTENPDVVFEAETVDPPSGAAIARVRARLETIIDRGCELIPDRVPDGDWDRLQQRIRRLRFTREITRWRDPQSFFEALSVLCKEGETGYSITQKSWKDKALARDFRDEVNAFAVGDTDANRVLRQWREHRYSLCVRLARRAAEEFLAYRRRAGRLDFQDLLLLTAELLRSRPEARHDLGVRYRRLLVDEFQDTDPLQAEIMLLLSSEPREGEGTESDWRTAVPRPGALFVVGDPKQSIYRFRRADIQLYQFVKERFSRFGDVVELTTNFRSRAPIGVLVNELFCREGFFPERATPEQATFERLNTLPAPDSDAHPGVFRYDVVPHAANRRAVAEDEAARLAAWIHRRVAAGERRPGSFLVLARTRASLEAYARALESWGLPVQVTGAGVGVEEELQELRILLQCMIDPTDPVKVVAVLVGLFVGLDHERLLAHSLSGGVFNAMRPPVQGDPEVLRALSRLHAWWRASIVQPADVFVSGIVSEMGLLPYAAAGDLGALRAGAMTFVLDTLRSAALAGGASLPGALHALDTALALTDAEAPLEPGRSDAVRVMNLHQAKGLEADVVVLADPSGGSVPSPVLHVRRQEDGTAHGYVRVTGAGFGSRHRPTLALPPEWQRWEAEERAFSEAEETRLLYVAVTRARDELWVGRWRDKPTESPWVALDAWLIDGATLVDLPSVDAPPASDIDPDEGLRVDALAGAASARLREAGRPGFTFSTVTALAKDATTGPSEPSADPGRGPGGGPLAGAFRGFSWGSAVHGALAVAAEAPDTESLRSACRSLLVEHGRPLDDHGDPLELVELMDLVRAVMASEIWERAARARRVYAEIPLAARGSASPVESGGVPEPDSVPSGRVGIHRQLDLFPSPSAPAPSSEDGAGDAAGRSESHSDEPARVLEGVVDLVFEESDGWVVVDYKTDVGTDPGFEERIPEYRRQVDLYAETWVALTGDPVKERVLFFTSQGRVERW